VFPLYNKCMETLDNIHWNSSRIDGCQKAMNCVISERGDGKSTAIIRKAVDQGFFQKGQPSILIRRDYNDINEAYINSLEGMINKFSKEKVKFKYKKGNLKDACIDLVYKEKIMFRVIALKADSRKQKSLYIENPYLLLFDEMIINTRNGEKYLTGEAFKLKEIISTYIRENFSMKSWLLGNPYSLYNPHFVEWGIDPLKLVHGGKILTGANWACEYHKMTPELRAYLIEKNPLYQGEHNAYDEYALNGTAINDKNIMIVPNLPQNYALEQVFYMDGKYIGIYGANDWNNPVAYYVGYLKNPSYRRDVFCFDFKDLTTGTTLFSRDERNEFAHFRLAMRSHAVAFQSLECDYLLEEIYNYL
jgi:hypothetical protein